MAKTGLFSESLTLRLGAKLSLSRTPSAELKTYSDVLVHFIDYVNREGGVK